MKCSDVAERYRKHEDLDAARAALHRCIARASDAGEDWALSMLLSYLATTEELAGDYATAAAALEKSDAIAALHDWPQSPGYLEPRCDLLIRVGNLDEALSLADTHLPDDAGGTRLTARLLRGFSNTSSASSIDTSCSRRCWTLPSGSLSRSQTIVASMPFPSA